MTDQDRLDLINELIRTARRLLYFMLPGFGIVLISASSFGHADFYAYATSNGAKIPWVNIEVHTTSFFYATPILTAAMYFYLQLHLVRLWVALGAAPARLNGLRLGDAISPWLVAEAVLEYRALIRNDNCVTPRTLEFPKMLLSLLLTWGFGLIVLAFLYWQSLPARNLSISSIALVSMLVALFAGLSSFKTMRKHLRELNVGEKISVFRRWIYYPIFLATAFWTYLLTAGPAEYLARVDLSGENIVERPAGWLSYADAQMEFRAEWCRREFIDDCSDLGNREEEFANEFQRRRSAAIGDLRKPDWHEPFPARTIMDFRNANMESAFLTGVNLSKAQMQNAYLNGAHLEGAYLDSTQLQRAVLSFAEMAGAVLSGAQLQGALMSGSELQSAKMIATQMERADLSEAHMQGANLSGAHLDGATLLRAQLQNVTLNDASLVEANLHRVSMTGAHLNHTNLEGSELFGARLDSVGLSLTQFSGSSMDFSFLSQDFDKTWESEDLAPAAFIAGVSGDGMAIRNANLEYVIFDTDTDLRNAFFDGSVRLPRELLAQSGDLCQTTTEVLDDKEFFGRWRGWLEEGLLGPGDPWEDFAPPGMPNVTAIPPAPGCTWKTDPIPTIIEHLE